MPESSEESFLTAASHAAPAASLVSDLDYASLEDESDEENRDEALQQQVRVVVVTACILMCFETSVGDGSRSRGA